MTDILNVLTLLSAIGYHIWAVRKAHSKGFLAGYTAGAEGMREHIFNQLGIVSDGENPDHP